MRTKGAYEFLGRVDPLGGGYAIPSVGVGMVPNPSNDVVVFGVPFWNPTYTEFADWWRAAISSDERKSMSMVLANAHTLNLAVKSDHYCECLKSVDIRLNDGAGFRIASGMRGVRTAYNFNGTDLIPKLLATLDRPVRVFLYGSKEKSNSKAAQVIAERFPNVEIVGRVNGYENVDETVVPMIQQSGADVLLVALGNPKQEIFMERYKAVLNVKIQIGCGGLFDFLSGFKRRAPLPMRERGMEWVYRLALEPKRMFARYVLGNPLFVVRSWTRRKADIEAMGPRPRRRRFTTPVL